MESFSSQKVLEVTNFCEQTISRKSLPFCALTAVRTKSSFSGFQVSYGIIYLSLAGDASDILFPAALSRFWFRSKVAEQPIGLAQQKVLCKERNVTVLDSELRVPRSRKQTVPERRNTGRQVRHPFLRVTQPAFGLSLRRTVRRVPASSGSFRLCDVQVVAQKYSKRYFCMVHYSNEPHSRLQILTESILPFRWQVGEAPHGRAFGLAV